MTILFTFKCILSPSSEITKVLNNFIVSSTTTKHIGHNVGRIRELRGIKQDGLAYAIGLSQQTISHIENSETVDDERLAQIARELAVSVEAIKNFSDEALMDYFNSPHEYNSHKSDGDYLKQCLDDLMASYKYSIKLHAEKEALYERLLAAEKDRHLRK